MQDRELMRRRRFKLQDTARRMKSLAREAKTPDAETRLNRLADEVCEMETPALGVLEGELPDTAAAPSAKYRCDAPAAHAPARRRD